MTRALALTAALLLSACGGVPFPRYELRSDDATRVALTARLVHPIGPTTMLQRAVIRIGAEETNLTLYVRVRPPDEVHVVALGDVGGTVFEARRDRDAVHVPRASPFIPEWVVRDIVEGLALALLAPQAGRLELVRFPGVETALHGADDSGRELLIWPDPRGDRIIGGEGGRLRRRAQVDWGEGGATSAPARLRGIGLEDAAAGYDASIEVLRVEPLAEAAPPRAGGR